MTKILGIPRRHSFQFKQAYVEVRSYGGIFPEVCDLAVVSQNEFVEDDVLNHGIE